jgi:RNA polymerase sigma factor (sigma-70 family)
LERLSRRQRTVVLLVEGLGLTYKETSRLLGVSRSSVQSHLERALDRLRRDLGVTQDV